MESHVSNVHARTSRVTSDSVTRSEPGHQNKLPSGRSGHEFAIPLPFVPGKGKTKNPSVRNKSVNIIIIISITIIIFIYIYVFCFVFLKAQGHLRTALVRNLHR